MIVSANLDKQARKIYVKINKLRKKGWFSSDISVMLVKKYGEEKKFLIEELNEKSQERNKLDEQIKTLAKKINKIK